ncbi:MAG: M18 family aminopeptidase, partial [Acidimicrobiales bacterium]
MAESRSGRASEHAMSILDDLQRSPTPYHAVEHAQRLLAAAGFSSAAPDERFPTEAGGRYVVNGGTLIAWWQPDPQRAGNKAAPFRVVGAHTDSPNLRVRTSPDVTAAGFEQVGMEIYGGVLLNSWLDRDLGLAGRVTVDAGSGQLETMLFCDDDPLLRIPQLAIHLDREIREKGLKLDPQRHLTPLWALSRASEGSGSDDLDGGEDPHDAGAVRRHVAEGLGIDAGAIRSWDLMAFDTQPPAVVGRDGDMFASARIDNLVSAFCAIRALTSATAASSSGDGADLPYLPVVVLYDHEEIGSESATGAAGALLGSTLERIAGAAGLDRQDYLAALAASLVVSADGAHATHPNYVDKHEPSHHIA